MSLPLIIYAPWNEMAQIMYSFFVPANSRAFFYRQRRLFDFVPFQPATGQALRWVVADIREPALGNIRNHTQTHRAKP